MLKDLATEYNFVKKKVANTYKLAPTILQDASQKCINSQLMEDMHN